jgi:hypothetical protein
MEYFYITYSSVVTQPRYSLIRIWWSGNPANFKATRLEGICLMMNCISHRAQILCLNFIKDAVESTVLRINPYGVHLNRAGTSVLARNILDYLNMHGKSNWCVAENSPTDDFEPDQISLTHSKHDNSNNVEVRPNSSTRSDNKNIKDSRLLTWISEV